MMVPSQRLVRGLFIVVLVAACVALAVAPMLQSANAAPPRAAAPANVVISQFRFIGSGGETDEFVELFNRSCIAVPVDGWTLQFFSGPTQGATALYTFLAGATLAPGQYFLIANGITGGGFNDPTPAGGPDLPTYSSNVDSTNGGVALLDASSAVVDKVGLNIDNSEGAPLSPLAASTDQGYVRKTVSSGMYVDTNNNAQDFSGPIASTPHNAASPVGTCGFPTQKITGNAGTAGVTLSYTDGTPQSVLSDASGNYTITVPSNWSGTVTPSLPGFTFTPPNRPYSNLLTDQTGQDYTLVANTPTKTSVPSATPQPFYGSVVINEVAWAGTKADSTDQWIELYNPRPYDIDLTNWELVNMDDPSGTTNWTIKFRPAGTFNGSDTPIIRAGGFYVIAPNKDLFSNSEPDYIFAKLALSKCGGCGDTLILYYRPDQPPIDYANYPGGAWPAGKLSDHRSMERHSTAADSPANWYTFIGPPKILVKDRDENPVLGSPGQKNWAYSVTATPSPRPTATNYRTATPRPPTPFAHMVINEFLPRAGTDWNQDKTVNVMDEFIEVKNLGPIDVDLRGWKLDALSFSGTTSFILPSTKLKTGDRAVFYRTTTNLALPDSGGTVRLTNTRGIVIDARSYGPVESPDQSTCRLPDGFYWRFPCFPTPGNENSLTGVSPAVPPAIASAPPPCLMADIVPAPFRDAECYGYGADVFNADYWDSQSGFSDFLVKDLLNKFKAVVR